MNNGSVGFGIGFDFNIGGLATHQVTITFEDGREYQFKATGIRDDDSDDDEPLTIYKVENGEKVYNTYVECTDEDSLTICIDGDYIFADILDSNVDEENRDFEFECEDDGKRIHIKAVYILGTEDQDIDDLFHTSVFDLDGNPIDFEDDEYDEDNIDDIDDEDFEYDDLDDDEYDDDEYDMDDFGVDDEYEDAEEDDDEDDDIERKEKLAYIIDHPFMERIETVVVNDHEFARIKSWVNRYANFYHNHCETDDEFAEAVSSFLPKGENSILPLCLNDLLVCMEKLGMDLEAVSVGGMVFITLLHKIQDGELIESPFGFWNFEKTDCDDYRDLMVGIKSIYRTMTGVNTFAVSTILGSSKPKLANRYIDMMHDIAEILMDIRDDETLNADFVDEILDLKV